MTVRLNPKIIGWASSVALVCGLIGTASADQTVRVCIGEDQANGCPVSKDAMFGCGMSIDAAAGQVCTVTRDGKKVVSPYRVMHQGSHDGGRCGYEWYQVTCLDQ
jgi:hypothetical protein